MKGFPITLLFLYSNVCILLGQQDYPFSTNAGNNNILAYWYNCPKDSIHWSHRNNTSFLHPYLQVYGNIPADSFQVTVKVFSNSTQIVFNKTFFIKESFENDSVSIEFNEQFFKMTSKGEMLHANPEKINVQIIAHNFFQSKTINCNYHKLYGQITDFDGNPHKGFIKIHPDSFELDFGVWSDENGFYEIAIPERSYNCFYVNDGMYKVNTLETWCWHMIVDSDQKLDFKIGTGEVYNLNTWINDGGASTYFISFRPMVLQPDEKTYQKEMNDKSFEVSDICPELEIQNLKVFINGKETELFSLQKYYETGKSNALYAYLVQVRRFKSRIGKQTIRLEYNKSLNINGKIISQTGMGYYEFYPNFSGLTYY